MVSLPAVALGVSAVVAGPLAAFAPLGMAPLAVATLLLAFLGAQRRHLRVAVYGQPIFLTMIVLWAWMMASAAWAIDPVHSLSTALRAGFLTIGSCALALLSSSLDGRGQILVSRCVLAGFGLLAAFVAIELISDGAIVRAVQPEKYADRTWAYVTVSRGAAVMALMLWAAVLSARLPARRAGLTTAVAVAAAAAGLLTEHSATQLALAAGLAAGALVYAFGRPMIAAIGGGLVALVLSAPLWPMGPLSPQALAPVTSWLKVSANHRLYIWQFVAERIVERPFFGWGIGSSRHIPGGDLRTAVGGEFLPLHPHNAGLQVWLELGAVGAIIAAVALATLVRHIAKLCGAPETSRAAPAAAMATLCAAFGLANVSFGIWQNWWLASLGLVSAWLVATSGLPGPTPRKAASEEHTHQPTGPHTSA